MSKPMSNYSGVIYKLNFPNGKCYIGQTVSYKDRMKSYAKLNCEKQPRLWSALSHYGWQSVVPEILCECISKEDMDQKEEHYISQYDSMKEENGYNMSPGGATGNTEAARKRNSEAVKKTGNSAWMHKIIAANKKRTGYKHTEETKRIIGEQSKQRRHTEETKRKIGESGKGHKGAVWTDEMKLKMVEVRRKNKEKKLGNK